MIAGSAGGNPNQLIEPRALIDLLGISVHPDTSFVTLRWSSKAESSYIIEETTDLQKGWKENLSGIVGGAGETTFTFSPIQDHGSSQTTFFRVREMAREITETSHIDPASTGSSNLEAVVADPSSPPPEKSDQGHALKLLDPAIGKAGTQTRQPTSHFHPSFVVG